ncbi:MAG TPA: FtsX-like permease family protein [Limnochordales bacterium]|nr:FtsX-like permease family protein [Limnochordales bacterium]
MWALAWRNVWRHKTRSLVAAGAVAAVVLFTLVFFGFVTATTNGMFELLTSESGHLQVIGARAREVQDFDARLIRDAQQVEAALLRELPAVRLRRVLEVPALISGETRARGALIVGVAQDEVLAQRFAQEHVAAGRLPSPGSWDEIALGAALARALQVELGDPVYVFAPGTEGWGAAAYTLVGLLAFPQTAYEIQAAYLSLEGAQELAAPSAVSRLEVHLVPERGVVTDAVIEDAKARAAAALGPAVRVETWREASPDTAAMLDLMDPAMAVFSLLIFVLAGLLVVNTIYLGLVERIREFGVIIAVGADRWRVMRMVLAESLVLVAAGTAVGLLTGGLLLVSWADGFRMPGLDEVLAEAGLPAVLYPAVTPAQVAVTVGFAVATALMAALWPAWVAGRLEPVEAMRHVA